MRRGAKIASVSILSEFNCGNGAEVAEFAGTFPGERPAGKPPVNRGSISNHCHASQEIT